MCVCEGEREGEKGDLSVLPWTQLTNSSSCSHQHQRVSKCVRMFCTTCVCVCISGVSLSVSDG